MVSPATWRAPFVDVVDGRQPAGGESGSPARAGALPSEAERLAIDLLNAVRGEVRFDAGSRAAYSTDASNYRQVPIGVVVPRDTDDVVAAVEVCRAHDVPIVSRGGGTSLAGQTCNVAVVLDHSKFHNDLLELNPDERWARVRPGLVLDELRSAAEEHHLTFGPDPGHPRSLHPRRDDRQQLVRRALGHGRQDRRQRPRARGPPVRRHAPARRPDERRRADPARDGAGSGERALPGDAPDPRRPTPTRSGARYPDIPRRVSGYNLDQLLPEHGFDVARALVGSESTLVTVLEAKLRLVPSPPVRTLVAVGYPDVYAAADDVPRVMESGCIACEGMDDKLVRDVRSRGIHPEALGLLPEGRGFLLVEFGGDDRKEAGERAAAFIDALRRRRPDADPKLYDDPADEQKLWKVRESGLGATAMVPGKPITAPGWEDSAVAPDRLGDYLREIRKLWDRYGLRRRHVRPLRPGRPPLPDRLRPASRAKRARGVPPVSRRRRRPGRRHGRLAVRGARRRPGSRRAAAADVRRADRRARSRRSRICGIPPGG